MSDTALIASCEDFIRAYQALGDAARDENETAYDQAAREAEGLINRLLGYGAGHASAGFRAKARAAGVALGWSGSGYIRRGRHPRRWRGALSLILAGIADGSSVVYLDRERRAASIGGRKDWR